MNPEPDDFQAACPSCRSNLRVLGRYRGRLVACRLCGCNFRPTPPEDLADADEQFTAGPVGEDDEGRLTVGCPACETPLRVRAKYIGRHVRCVSCGGKFRVDGATSATASAELAIPGPASAPTPDPDGPAGSRHLFDLVGDLLRRVQRLEAERDEALDAARSLRDDLERAGVLPSRPSRLTGPALVPFREDSRRRQTSSGGPDGRWPGPARDGTLASRPRAPRPFRPEPRPPCPWKS